MWIAYYISPDRFRIQKIFFPMCPQVGGRPVWRSMGKNSPKPILAGLEKMQILPKLPPVESSFAKRLFATKY